jgi:hypothetical protein
LWNPVVRQSKPRDKRPRWEAQISARVMSWSINWPKSIDTSKATDRTFVLPVLLGTFRIV